MKQSIYIIILLMLAICFVSCRTQYIPVESVRTEYKTRDSIRYDSIYQRDSIYTLIRVIQSISIDISICIAT